MSYFEKGSTLMKVCIISVILVVLGIIIFNVFKSNKTEVIEEKKVYEYFSLYTLDEKAGVVDKKGKVIIEPEYIAAYIPNPSKDVFVLENEDGYIVFDSKGNKLFEDFEKISVIKMNDYSEEVEMNVLTYEENSKKGIIDLSGNKLTEAIYDDIKSLESRPGRILVKKDGKYGVLDLLGNVIVEVKYNAVKSDGYSTAEDGYTKTGFIISERTDNGIIYGYVNYEGNIVIEPKYESLVRVNKKTDDIYLIVMERGKKGVIKNSKQLIKNNFQSVTYSEIADIFVVEKVSKYGFYSLDGDEILKPTYPNYVVSKEYITVEENDKTVMYDFFGNVVKTNNYASVSEVEGTSYFIAKSEEGYYSIISKDVNVNDKYIYIEYAFGDYFIFTNEENKTGVLHVWEGVVIEPTYEVVLKVEDMNAIEARDEANTLHLYNSKLEEVFALENAVVQKVDDNYTVIYSDTEMKYINKDGKIVENTEVYPDNKLYSIQKDGKWGFINNVGEVVVSCKYDLVTELNSYGFAGVKQDDKWGVIDEKGKEIVVPVYEINSYYFPQFIGKYELYRSDILVCLELEEE